MSGFSRIAMPLRKFCRRERFGLIWGVALALGCSATLYLCPRISGALVDQVVYAEDVNLVWPTLARFVIVCMAQPVLGFLDGYVFLNMAERTVAYIRQIIIESILSKDYRFIERTDESESMARVTNDARAVARLFVDIFSIGVRDATALALVVWGMLSESAFLTALVVILLATYHILSWRISMRLERISKLRLQRYERLCSDLSHLWQNLMLIKSLRIEGSALSDFLICVKRAKDTNQQAGIWNAVSNGLSSATTVLSLACIYGTGAVMVIRDQLSLGSVLALGMYFQLLASPVMELTSLLLQYKQTLPSVDRLRQYMDDGRSRLLPPVVGSLSAGPSIEFSHVFFSYGMTGARMDAVDSRGKKGSFALDDVSFEIKGPGLVCLTGCSGSGKSTLLKLACGLYPARSGAITVCGNKLIDGICSEDCALVCQDAELLVGQTVLYNLLPYARTRFRDGAPESLALSGVLEEAEVDSRTENMITRLGLSSVIAALPDGMYTVITQKGCFSGGERRRLALARALLSDKKVLLLDEITTGLDSDSVKSVLELLDEASKDRLVIVGTHDKRLVDCADSILSIDGGEVLYASKCQTLCR